MAQKLNGNDGIANAASDPLAFRRRAQKPDGFSGEPLNSKAGCPQRKEPAGLQSDPDLTKRIAFPRIGAGLANLGNTCFLNSVLQCLTYTEPLAAYLQSGRHKTACRASGFCAMCAIQNHVTNALGSSGKILAPSHLVKNLRSISRSFRISRQEDAHEYMVNLMESMHKCCLPSGIASESPNAYEKSLVHKIFGGRLRSQVKCTECLYGSNTYDPFLDLSLQIVHADSVVKALSHFTAVEQLDGGERRYQCEHCKVKVQALKQLTVDKAPYVLAIHLKRFSPGGFGGKIDKKVEFGPTLDMKPFVSGPHEWNLKYTLYGVLVHAGWSTRSGHYYCFIHTSSGIWHALDDNRVYQVSEKSVLEQKAYMLFYVRDKRMVYQQPIFKAHLSDFVPKDGKGKPVNMASEKENQSRSYAPVVSHNSLCSNSAKETIIKGKDQILRKQDNLSNGTFTFESEGPSHNAELLSSVGKQSVSVESLSRHPVTWESDAARNGGMGKLHNAGSSGHQVVPTGNGIVVDHTADNGNRTAKHLVNVAGNGHRTDINLHNGVADNEHKTAEHFWNDDTINHYGTKNLSNGDIFNDADGHGCQAAEPLGNGHMANHSSAVKHEATKCSSLGNGTVIVEKNEYGAASLSKEHGAVKGVSLKKIEPNSLSNLEEEPSCPHIFNMQEQKPENRRVDKKVKCQKHFKYPHLLSTMPLARRHLFLTAIIISKHKRSYKSKKCVHLKHKSFFPNNSLKILNSKKGVVTEQHDVLSKKRKDSGSVEQKAFDNENESGSNVTNCPSNAKQCSPCSSNDQNNEMRTSTVQNGSSSLKVGQTSFESSLNAGSAQSSSRRYHTKNGMWSRAGAVKENIGEPFFGTFGVGFDCQSHKSKSNDSVLCSGTNKKEYSVSAPALPNGDVPARCRLPERGNFVISLKKAQEHDMTRFTQNGIASLAETELQGITVTRWNDIEGVESDSAVDHERAGVGYVLDEWYEEYDWGRRKKVKISQCENGTIDSNKRHSNGCLNPMKAVESSGVQLHSSRTKRAVVRNQPARIRTNN